MPETVFYQKGKASLMVKSDKSFCLVAEKGEGRETSKLNKLSNENIFKELSIVVMKRKLDRIGILRKSLVDKLRQPFYERIKVDESKYF